jgi:ABC-type glycerol-3-phosphate transport system permease component
MNASISGRQTISVPAPMVPHWPVLAFATVSITYHWNEYLWPLMMLNDPDKQVLTVGLRRNCF